MKRPSKKDIQAAVDKLKEAKPGGSSTSDSVPQKLEAKKSNKNRLRRHGT